MTVDLERMQRFKDRAHFWAANQNLKCEGWHAYEYGIHLEESLASIGKYVEDCAARNQRPAIATMRLLLTGSPYENAVAPAAKEKP